MIVIEEAVVALNPKTRDNYIEGASYAALETPGHVHLLETKHDKVNRLIQGCGLQTMHVERSQGHDP